MKLAKPMDIEISLNRVKKKDGALTTSYEEALETVRDYFKTCLPKDQDLKTKNQLKCPALDGINP